MEPEHDDHEPPVIPGEHSHEPHRAYEPLCLTCGYKLSGLRIDGVCPECGTPVYAGPDTVRTAPGSQAVLVWGIVSIVTLFACLGPLAGFLAIYPIVKGGRIRADAKAGRIPEFAAQAAKTGYMLGWITAGLSIAFVILYGLFLLVMLGLAIATP